MKIMFVTMICIVICVALLTRAGRITKHGWDFNPYPHRAISLQLKRDRLALYSLQLDAAHQRQCGNIAAAEKDYRLIISSPVTLRNGEDYVIKTYVVRAQASLTKVREEKLKAKAST